MPLTPMMQKYMETKEEYKDCILFYRLGDFYEMFFEDAKTCSQELDLTLCVVFLFILQIFILTNWWARAIKWRFVNRWRIRS